MRLAYAEVPNFGDALNPYIFNHFLPDFFDEQSDEVLIGIGSILGFKQFDSARKKIVFSSGYAVGYADPPTIDKTYDIICVRGPLTARELDLDVELAVTDGACLLRFMDHDTHKKKYKFTYIPHKSTEKLYDWERVCRETGINYVSPEAGVIQVLTEILQSEVILAEAMHGAIVADTFRIPWIPVITNDRVNEYKWKDWTASLELEYSPRRIPRIYQFSHLKRGLQVRFGTVLPGLGIQSIARTIGLWQQIFIEDKVYESFDALRKVEPFLSNDRIFNKKSSKLRSLLYDLEKRYKKLL